MPARAVIALFALFALVGPVSVVACSGGDSSSDVPGATFTVHAKDTNTFDKTAYETKAGNLTIGYKNDGQLVHTLLIDGHPEFKIAVARNQPTASGTVSLTPGTYTFFCDVPGHREEGMVAKLTVE